MKISILLGVTLCCACAASAQSQTPSPQPPRAESPALVLPDHPLGAGDLVDIFVHGAPELSRPMRIGADGKLRFPLLSEPITGAGLMPDDLAKSIAGQLQAQQLLVDPLVRVSVTEYGSRPVSITGAVRHPVTFQAYGGATLLTALAKAEGIGPEAGPNILVSIPHAGPDGRATRTIKTIPITALMTGQDPALNIELKGGEEIRVPEAERVYVAGNVRKAGAFPIQESSSLSVLKVLALAEGLAPFARKEAYIYRHDPATNTKREIPVPLSDIVQRKAADIPLQGGDIFYVPDNRGRRLTVSALERLAGFGSATASGVLIWR